MVERNEFIARIVPPEAQKEPAWWFAFAGDRLLVHLDFSGVSLPCVTDLTELGLVPIRRQYLGQLGRRHCYSAELAEGVVAPPEMALEGLRQIYDRIGEGLFWVAARAIQIVDWDRTQQFCGRCGEPTKTRAEERAKECSRCGLLHFPRLAPAIIVLIERGHKVLLARSRHFAPGLYSVLAGFVEPGETLEEAVIREVREEVGLVIKEIRYFGSQPWPFPHSLMIGFTAAYESGEITLEDPEVEDAGWFMPGSLPTLPGKISIARKLIDWFLEKAIDR
ncbi:MAG: NAD(+) diphosphatase [Deltaproteobacteria bacterium]|nr:MAG: NAD(+) diphosphatase [Deltaproteobacteria bacterium]